MDKISKNTVSIAGEFAVLSQLALRGYDANMTLGNTKSVDILVSNPANGRMFKIEVKTAFDKKPSISANFGRHLSWIMSDKHELINDPNLFYVFVNIENKTNSFRFFIVPSKVVSEYVKEEHEFWLKNRKGEAVKTSMRQFRLGLGGEYKINTPLVEDFENKWDFSFDKD